MPSSRFIPDLIDAAKAAGDVANYCDHVEHNEVVDAGWVLNAGRTLREVAERIATREGVDLQDAYAARLARIEQRGVRGVGEAFDGAAAARAAVSWADLQQVQVQHDREYHPDVVGLHKSEQLRHYALHVAKLSAAIAKVVEDEGERGPFLQTRLPDLLLFGMKLATVMGRPLPAIAISPVADAAVPAHAA